MRQTAIARGPISWNVPPIAQQQMTIPSSESPRALAGATDHLRLQLLQQAAVHHLRFDRALKRVAQKTWADRVECLCVNAAVGELQDGAKVHTCQASQIPAAYISIPSLSSHFSDQDDMKKNWLRFLQWMPQILIIPLRCQRAEIWCPGSLGVPPAGYLSSHNRCYLALEPYRWGEVLGLALSVRLQTKKRLLASVAKEWYILS